MQKESIINKMRQADGSQVDQHERFLNLERDYKYLNEEYQALTRDVELLKENNKELKEINQILKKRLRNDQENRSEDKCVSVSIFSDEEEEQEVEVNYTG